MTSKPIAIALLLLPSLCAAQAAPSPRATATTIAVVGLAGLGGSSDVGGRAWVNGELENYEETTDLATTYGTGLQVDAPIHRMVSVGAIARASWWTGEGGEKRALSGDLLVSARLRQPIDLQGRGSWCIVFAQVYGGLGVTKYPLPDGPGTFSVSTDASPVIGSDFGAQFIFPSGVGLQLSLGVMHREMPLVLSARSGGQQAELNVTVSSTQPLASIGLVVAL
jgi:hypothetical protein